MNAIALDTVQTGFDVAGLLPGVGAPFDGANALISLARGDPAGAARAAAAMVPGAGIGATSAKWAARYGDWEDDRDHPHPCGLLCRRLSSHAAPVESA